MRSRPSWLAWLACHDWSDRGFRSVPVTAGGARAELGPAAADMAAGSGIVDGDGRVGLHASLTAETALRVLAELLRRGESPQGDDGAAVPLTALIAAADRSLTTPRPQGAPRVPACAKVGGCACAAVAPLSRLLITRGARVVRGPARELLTGLLWPACGDDTATSGRLREIGQVAALLARCERPGLADRFAIQALSLADLTGDAALGGDVLAWMSSRALRAGAPGAAVDLAVMGQRLAGITDAPGVMVSLLAAEAHAHLRLAVDGDLDARRAALAACAQAAEIEGAPVPETGGTSGTGQIGCSRGRPARAAGSVVQPGLGPGQVGRGADGDNILDAAQISGEVVQAAAVYVLAPGGAGGVV